MTPREILLRAADLCEERGMCARAIEDSHGRLCAIGALIVAEHGSTALIWGYNTEASRALQKVIGTNWDQGIVDWSNNLVDEGKSHVVIKGFRDAAASLGH